MKSAQSVLYKLSVFIFRRDLRLEDNRGLNASLKQSERVLPCFIFDEAQIDRKKNEFFSNNCVQFMIESLQELNEELNKSNSRLFFFNGSIESEIKKILDNVKPNAIFVNEDITPYSKKRDQLIQELCTQQNVAFHSYHDTQLLEKDKVLLKNGNFYQVFTPYYKLAQKEIVELPEIRKQSNFIDKQYKVPDEYQSDRISDFYVQNELIEVKGGRKNGLKILEKIKNHKNYAQNRNFPGQEGTTRLSAYNKFGVVSIREVYDAIASAFGKEHELIRQLFWRDFYYNILYYNPIVIGNALKPQYRNIAWENNKEQFEAWKQGMTGYPIVDAAMRCLNKTGWMHNRLRMVVSSFLIKDLLIDWQLGEKYFAQQLVDYDPALNNGGWQWSSSTGCDSQPYFRIFNPTSQSQKFDANCQFILKWIPELKNVNKTHIHSWEQYHQLYTGKNKTTYPNPIVSHDIQRKKALALYQSYSNGNQDGTQDVSDGEEDQKKKKQISTQQSKLKRKFIDDELNNSNLSQAKKKVKTNKNQTLDKFTKK